MDELIITWQGLLFEAVAFLVFTYLLNLFLLKPIRNLLKKRLQIIGGHNGNAEKFEKLREKTSEEVRREKNDLKAEINKIKEESHKAAAAAAAEINAAAKIDASVKYGEIIKSFDEEKKNIADYYKSRTGEIAGLIRKKLLD